MSIRLSHTIEVVLRINTFYKFDAIFSIHCVIKQSWTKEAQLVTKLSKLVIKLSELSCVLTNKWAKQLSLLVTKLSELSKLVISFHIK